jgi:acyl-CoA reductase-like NAD-dependent aldehyde dehydrogenase
MTTSHDTLFIGGEWVPPSSASGIEVRNASTGEVIGSVPWPRSRSVTRSIRRP